MSKINYQSSPIFPHFPPFFLPHFPPFFPIFPHSSSLAPSFLPHFPPFFPIFPHFPPFFHFSMMYRMMYPIWVHLSPDEVLKNVLPPPAPWIEPTLSQNRRLGTHQWRKGGGS